jgi:hypothetical protein
MAIQAGIPQRNWYNQDIRSELRCSRAFRKFFKNCAPADFRSYSVRELDSPATVPNENSAGAVTTLFRYSPSEPRKAARSPTGVSQLDCVS